MDKITIPYNDETKHIYEAFAKVRLEIIERLSREN